MSAVIDLMLSRFTTLYGEPKTENLSAFMGEYVSALRNASPDVLRAATDALIRTNTHRSWPTIGRCMEAVTLAADERAPRDKTSTSYRRSLVAPPSAEELEKRRLAKEWRDQMEAEFGSVEKALEAHQRKRNAVPMASRKSSFRHVGLTERSLRMAGDAE